MFPGLTHVCGSSASEVSSFVLASVAGAIYFLFPGLRAPKAAEAAAAEDAEKVAQGQAGLKVRT